MTESYDITRLNELYALTLEGRVIEWDIAIQHAWPAISARLKLLEEFVMRVRESEAASSCCGRQASLTLSVRWLDSEQQKASVPT